MQTLTVTTWSLEQTSPQDLRPARAPGAESALRVARAEVASPEFSRFLYTAVGVDVRWSDRLPWTRARWQQFLERPAVETWVAWERGTPAGFLELEGQAEGTVEITYFGLLPAFRGRGIGGHLLSHGTARAWDLASRWPRDRVPTRRVWLHTCSKDGPYALDNYRRRGFRIFGTRTRTESVGRMPELWPET
ncbi:GNAT family N-acetyltransferase [Streptomyces sp. TR02-1]|uniref:GNAT family N-acetyltransferase n=1 Tax=Streptomyces sp. TR02-1 TaxID=3385977 RepID=UPI00399EECAD